MCDVSVMRDCKPVIGLLLCRRPFTHVVRGAGMFDGVHLFTLCIFITMGCVF